MSEAKLKWEPELDGELGIGQDVQFAEATDEQAQALGAAYQHSGPWYVLKSPVADSWCVIWDDGLNHGRFVEAEEPEAQDSVRHWVADHLAHGGLPSEGPNLYSPDAVEERGRCLNKMTRALEGLTYIRVLLKKQGLALVTPEHELAMRLLRLWDTPGPYHRVWRADASGGDPVQYGGRRGQGGNEEGRLFSTIADAIAHAEGGEEAEDESNRAHDEHVGACEWFARHGMTWDTQGSEDMPCRVWFKGELFAHGRNVGEAGEYAKRRSRRGQRAGGGRAKQIANLAEKIAEEEAEHERCSQPFCGDHEAADLAQRHREAALRGDIVRQCQCHESCDDWFSVPSTMMVLRSAGRLEETLTRFAGDDAEEKALAYVETAYKEASRE